MKSVSRTWISFPFRIEGEDVLAEGMRHRERGGLMEGSGGSIVFYLVLIVYIVSNIHFNLNKHSSS